MVKKQLLVFGGLARPFTIEEDIEAEISHLNPDTVREQKGSFCLHTMIHFLILNLLNESQNN